jgi:UDP-N-acetylmuramate--alanine ligase
MCNAFQEFADKTKNRLVLCGDDKNIRSLKVKNAYYYGFNDNNNLVIKNKKVVDNKTKFDIYYDDELFDHYEVNMFGNHLILDLSAAVLISILYNIPKNIIKDVLEHFIPAKRRFNETIIKDNVVVDDYAHHPTEIRVTYDSAHQKYANKKIVGIFIPNTYSRTKDLFDDFVKALSYFDKAYLMEIKCDREKQEDYPNINSDKLIDKLTNGEKISLDDIDKLKDLHNTVICFMSCANISPLVEKTKEILK